MGKLRVDLAKQIAEDEARVVVAAEDVRDWVADKRGLGRNDNKLERSSTLRKAMKAFLVPIR